MRPSSFTRPLAQTLARTLAQTPPDAQDTAMNSAGGSGGAAVQVFFPAAGSKHRSTQLFTLQAFEPCLVFVAKADVSAANVPTICLVFMIHQKLLAFTADRSKRTAALAQGRFAAALLLQVCVATACHDVCAVPTRLSTPVCLHAGRSSTGDPIPAPCSLGSLRISLYLHDFACNYLHVNLKQRT
eukprot:6212313-Pleurochrysis_carterae.AAC.6